MIDMRVKEGQIGESRFFTMFIQYKRQKLVARLSGQPVQVGSFPSQEKQFTQFCQQPHGGSEAAAGSILIPRIWTRIPNRYPLQQYHHQKGLVGNICHPLQCTNLLLIFTCIILTANSYFMPILTSIKGFSFCVAKRECRRKKRPRIDKRKEAQKKR